VPDTFQTGWQLTKESWNFHRKFHRLFRRPMRQGEYSHLLWQVRRRTAEHLGENYWRVRLPDSDRTLPICATVLRLITILPKGWQPPDANQESRLPRGRRSRVGANEPEAKSRTINATAWEPPPGMVKALCQQCGYWFAAPGPDTPLRADCAAPPREAGEDEHHSQVPRDGT
jgi:hypothetical protein